MNQPRRIPAIQPATPDAETIAQAQQRRDELETARQAAEPAKRAALETANSTPAIEAAVSCRCACHPRGPEYSMHGGGATCPCQLSDEERREQTQVALAELAEHSEPFHQDEQVRTERAVQVADQLGITLEQIGGAAPFTCYATIDGTDAYLRERHDLWALYILEPGQPGDARADDWRCDRIQLAAGSADDLVGDAPDDLYCHVVTFICHHVRRWHLIQGCRADHATGRYCTNCGRLNDPDSLNRPVSSDGN